jgi:chlorite dismutase
MDSRLAHFSAGSAGEWIIREIRPVRGASLPLAERLRITAAAGTAAASWCLRGIRSNARYTTAEEKVRLDQRQEGLGRTASTRAVLIPIKKTGAWWQLSQDERREIFEEQSRHTSVGLEYLPAIARRLYHCRDLGTEEPFDFLTWFEFSPDHEKDFDSLLVRLRASREWDFVEREVDVRLVAGGPGALA